MFRSITDLAASGTAFPTGLTGAFLSGPNLEGIDAEVLDARAANSAAIAVGTLYVEQLTAANAGDGSYLPSAAASQALPMFSYGVLTGVPSNFSGLPAQSANLGKSTGQNEIRVRQKGSCLALCTTGATPIAAGTPLAADGAGNLTPYAGAAPGVVLAIAKGVLAANTAAPTPVLVNVGGY